MSVYLMHIVLWIVCFLEVALCFGLLDVFFDMRSQLNKKKLIGMIVCVGIVGGMLAINRQIVFFSHNMWILSMLITSLFVVTILRKHFLLAIEVVLIFYSAIALLDFFFVFIVESLSGGIFWYKVYFETISWWGMLILCATRVVGIYLLGLARKMLPKGIDYFVIEKILVPICVVLCVLVRFFQCLLVAIARDGFIFKSWSVGVVILSCLVILLFVAIFFQKSIIFRNEKEILQAREDMQELRYLELQKQSEENKHIIHDIKNHILILQGLCIKKDMAAMSAYLQDMNGMFEEYMEEFWCDDVFINTILNQKIKLAKEQDILCEIESVPHIKSPLGERETVIVFGNLLDNAIEACIKLPKDKRNITVIMKQKKSLFRLEIINSIQKKPIISDNKIVTSKFEGQNHGYGLKNVVRVVDKYQGAMLLDATEHKFKVSIAFFV